MNYNLKVRRAKGISYSELPEEVILLDSNREVYIGITGSYRTIWNMLDIERSVEDLIGAIDPSEHDMYVNSIEEMVQNNLVVVQKVG